MSKEKNDYLIFILSLLLLGLGISLVTKSNLGVSAVTSLPYVLSEATNLSFGLFILLMNTFYFFVQIVILRRNFPKNEYLQIIVGPILGFIVNLNMHILKNIVITRYSLQIIILIFGCLLTGISIRLQLIAKVITIPTEGLVKLISDKSEIAFSKVKIYFDMTSALFAVLISFAFFGEVVGLREGTLISAFIVGYSVHFFEFFF